MTNQILMIICHHPLGDVTRCITEKKYFPEHGTPMVKLWKMLFLFTYTLQLNWLTCSQPRRQCSGAFMWQLSSYFEWIQITVLNTFLPLRSTHSSTLRFHARKFNIQHSHSLPIEWIYQLFFPSTLRLPTPKLWKHQTLQTWHPDFRASKQVVSTWHPKPDIPRSLRVDYFCQCPKILRRFVAPFLPP